MEYLFLSHQNIEEWIPQLVILHNKCFSGEIDNNYFLWRYINNPNSRFIVNVAIENGTIVGSIGTNCNEFMYKGKKVKAALLWNAMVSPDYRNNGILGKMTNRLFRLFNESGIEICYLFPNYISNRLFNKELKVKTIYEIPTMELELETYKCLNLKFDVDNYFLFDYSKNGIGELGRAYILKDKQYLKWRYVEHYCNIYTNIVIKEGINVMANLICKEYNNELNIVEINYHNEEQIKRLIECAICYGNRCGKQKVTVWAPINTMLHAQLEKKMFKNNYPITYFGVKIFSEEIYLKELENYENWFVQQNYNHIY